MVSLVDQDGLHIELQDLRDPESRRYRISFERVPAYRNILEEYRLSEPPPAERVGWTRIDLESKWLSDLRKSESLLDVHTPGCRHYKIVTEDDVIDVLAPEQPMIREVEPSSRGASSLGKSTIYYHPDDREQIDQLFGELREEERDSQHTESEHGGCSPPRALPGSPLNRRAPALHGNQPGPDLRQSIHDEVRLLSSAQAQLDYERSAPTADVPAELICGFVDDLYRPKSAEFIEAFTEGELKDLAELYGRLCVASDAFLREEASSVSDILKIAEWRTTIMYAKELCARLGGKN